MPTKSKDYKHVKFPPEVIKQAFQVLVETLDPSTAKNIEAATMTNRFAVDFADESWRLSNEAEFFAEYRKTIKSARYWKAVLDSPRRGADFDVSYNHFYTSVSVGLLERSDVEKVFSVFEENYEKYRLPEPDKIKAVESSVSIFIGHGRDPQWRDLLHHLHHLHNFEVTSYETGARAGMTITEVLAEMTAKASFALLVLTAEDAMSSGEVRARENVIHETGLFQGKLGFKRAIVLLEEGCNEFTNLAGIQQIRFAKGNIKETFGDILATIYREFGAR